MDWHGPVSAFAPKQLQSNLIYKHRRLSKYLACTSPSADYILACSLAVLALQYICLVHFQPNLVAGNAKEMSRVHFKYFG